ncbi:alpha/beta hydrolase [Monashia sp. NPDC004114]
MGASPARLGAAVVGTVAGALGALAVVTRLTPWPSAMLVRVIFDRGARDASDALEKHVPPGLHEVLGETYAAGDPDARIDVFRPAGSGAGRESGSVLGPLPTVVWIHGGAFVSGNRTQVANYLRMIAGQGFTTVGVDYSIAPEARYPAPVRQVNAALDHLVQHADRLDVDPTRIVLAGDSAGAQIAAQVAALASDPAYAERVGITTAIDRDQLAGAVLFCGAFDFDLVRGSSRLGSWLIDTALWAYSGRRDYLSDETLQLASVAHHIPTTFPATFVSAGNADPLLPHSLSLVATLERLGVVHETLFFAEDHSPALQHEYQFDLDSVDGQVAFERLVTFLRRVTDF